MIEICDPNGVDEASTKLLDPVSTLDSEIFLQDLIEAIPEDFKLG